MATIIVIVAVLLVVLCVLWPQWHESRLRQKDYWQAEEADELMIQAEAAILTRQLGQAEILFNRALRKALPVDALLASEAYLGLARVCLEENSPELALPYLQYAVDLVPNWPVDKPEFAHLLRGKLDSLKRKLGK